MMVDIARDAQPNPFEFEEELVENANCMAKLSMEYLSTIGISATSSSCQSYEYPSGLLLEVAAIARLWHWEHVGIKDAIDPSLPSSQQTLSDLNDRFQDKSWLDTVAESPLLRKILLAWWNYCARGSRTALGVDIVVRQPSQDELIDCLASLLWQFRHLSNREKKTNGKTQEK